MPGLAAALASPGTATIALHTPLSGAPFEDWVYLPPPFTADTLRTGLKGTGR